MPRKRRGSVVVSLTPLDGGGAKFLKKPLLSPVFPVLGGLTVVNHVEYTYIKFIHAAVVIILYRYTRCVKLAGAIAYATPCGHFF